MVRLLMQTAPTPAREFSRIAMPPAAFALARDRGYADIVAAIEEEEQHRREAMSCPNVSVSPVQEPIVEATKAMTAMPSGC